MRTLFPSSTPFLGSCFQRGHDRVPLRHRDIPHPSADTRESRNRTRGRVVQALCWPTGRGHRALTPSTQRRLRTVRDADGLNTTHKSKAALRGWLRRGRPATSENRRCRVDLRAHAHSRAPSPFSLLLAPITSEILFRVSQSCAQTHTRTQCEVHTPWHRILF